MLEEQNKQNVKDHSVILAEVSKISVKLDTAISNKADKSDLDTLNSRFWGFILAFAVAFLGIISFLIQSSMGDK